MGVEPGQKAVIPEKVCVRGLPRFKQMENWEKE